MSFTRAFSLSSWLLLFAWAAVLTGQSQTVAEPPAVASPPPVVELQAAGDDGMSPEEVDALLELQADLDALFAFTYPEAAPGATVLVTRGETTLLRAAFGMADLELDVKMEPDMVLRIGSVTKQFTAVALLMLVEEGKVRLEAPLTEYLPDYPVGDPPITLLHLLTHTSGIPSYTDMDNFLGDVEEDFTVAAMIDRFKDQPLEFAPGTDYAYNNSAYFLLGAVIEKVSGKPYEQFIQERIFDPLGMQHSTYGGHAKLIPRRVSGYGGTPNAYLNAPYLSMSQPYAAGALLSTVDDLALWDAALNTDRLVQQETLERAWTSATLADGRSIHYGYGWGVREYEGHRILSHGGGIFGFTAHVVRIPDAEIFVAVLSNNPVLPPGTAALALRAALTALGKPLETRTRNPLDPALLDGYLGLYEIEGNPEDFRVITREDNQLYTQRRGGRRFPVYSSAKDRFYYADSIGELRFLRDRDGTVIGSEWSDGAGPAERATRTDREASADPRAIAYEATDFDAFVGRYRLREGIELTVRREGERFFIQATGQPSVEILPETATRFFVEGAPLAIEFTRGDGGAVVGFILQQGGRETTGERIQ